MRRAEEISDVIRLESGVRHKGSNSPLLFNLYINALIEQLSGIHVGYYVGGVCFNNISYTVDMVLLALSLSAFCRLLSVCESFVVSRGLLYNFNKSEYIGFQCSSWIIYMPVYLNSASLRRVRQEESSVKTNMLARRFCRCSLAVKITLFKAFCTSLHSGCLWVDYTQRI